MSSDIHHTSTDNVNCLCSEPDTNVKNDVKQLILKPPIYCQWYTDVNICNYLQIKCLSLVRTVSFPQQKLRIEPAFYDTL